MDEESEPGTSQKKKHTQTKNQKLGDRWRSGADNFAGINSASQNRIPLEGNFRNETYTRNPGYGFKVNQRNVSSDSNTRYTREKSHNIFRDKTNHKNKSMTFRTLQEMAQIDSSNILLKINERKEQFSNFLKTPVDNDKPDLHVLVVAIMSKISQSSFDQLKLQLLLEICNSVYMGCLRNYLIDLPYVERKAKNSLYWRNQNEFWLNIITFYECVINLLPSIALQKCRSLIEATTRSCLDGLKEKHGYNLAEHCSAKLSELYEILMACDIENKIKREREHRQHSRNNEDTPPPENFRELSILPNREDLMEKDPYLRSNIIDGAYTDIEHYLDVQFRLLREDCFGPLRHGLYQFIQDPNKKKFDNIRIYRNVKFIEPYITGKKIGLMVQIYNNKRMKRINWPHSKRLLFGSLLLFTKNNCRSFIVATVLDRDMKYLVQGKIPVTLVEGIYVEEHLCNDDTYVMIESEVYFEPYYHVLKALQDPQFPKHLLTMADYIINIKNETKAPIYLNENPEVTVITIDNNTKTFKVLEPETWPSTEELGLNESQYRAYQLALTHEFCLIQGPPGTGKTFLGVKIAETLLRDVVKHINGRCFMLVICYTNHALDQFLQNILLVTDSIVRIGGQSRNEAMEKININKLRGTFRNTYFHEQRLRLKSLIEQLKSFQHHLSLMINGIIDYNTIKTYIEESRIIGQFYSQNNNQDPLEAWLFEHMDYYDFKTLLQEFDENDEKSKNVVEIEKRDEVIIDDLSDDEDVATGAQTRVSTKVKTVFSLSEAEVKYRVLMSYFKKCKKRVEMEVLSQQIIQLQAKIQLFNNMSVYRDCKNEKNTNQQIYGPPGRISTVDRWKLYFKWARVVIEHVKKNLKPLQDSLHSANEAYEEARMVMDLELLKRTKVVGMTTSGAARLRKLLIELKAPIVIVEEAAEVLEAHIVTSLTKNTQHVILIGDHQQLRPSAACTKLARRYNIEISLFERMIMNNIHSCRLDVQHRMRPEIAALISPHIYKDLRNHESVNYFPQVRGMTANMFFFSHNFQEVEVEDSASKANYQEADVTLGLANYLMQQDYKPEDIVILAAYSGQMFYMKKQRVNYAHISGVKITVVDNYQGEEAKIILLSLVRNNDQNKIGFLSIENRVCVALSRAREGFYMFGNIDILKNNSELWTNIANTLEVNGNVGTSLRLRCENHGEITNVSKLGDFQKVPEGGCTLQCTKNFSCGHQCSLICHGYDRSHVDMCIIRCTVPCEREICELDHKCPLKCWEKCQPCNQLVKKTLPCRHDKDIACHLEPDDPKVKCDTVIKVTLPHCGHEANKLCFIDIKSVACCIPCVYRIEKCGHECRRNCHVIDDPHHEKYECSKPCAKAKKGCTAKLIGDRGDHQCYKKCYEDCEDCKVEVKKKRSNCKHSERIACNENVDEKPCTKRCARTLSCNHFCKKKCFEQCGDCKEKVVKTIPDCNHKIAVECRIVPTRILCRAKCERKLSCGHLCDDKCCNDCDPAKCTEIVDKSFGSPCGHQVKLPCNLYNKMISNSLEPDLMLKFCTAPCNFTLDCEHVCKGTCAQCRQGRMHVSCRQTCHKTMICGHECQEPCNVICPPCKLKCEIKCPHTLCGKLCGELCTPCQEKCNRGCRHGVCTNRCGEPCSRAPCSQPCALTRPCGHPCRGLCGEPCPDICKQCRPNDFPKDFLDYDFDDDEMFIQLQDCVHMFSVSDMDNLMTGDMESIHIRVCPLCRKPILNTHRYKDIINEMFKDYINPIKEKIYGNKEAIFKKKIEIHNILMESRKIHLSISQEIAEWRYAFLKLFNSLKSNKNISMLQIEMHETCLTILNKIGSCYKDYKTNKSSLLKDELIDVIKILCSIIMVNCNKITKQQQMDIANEVQRLKSIIQFAKILSNDAYCRIQNITNVITAKEAADRAVLGWRIFDEDDAYKELQNLEKILQVSGIITKQERDLIVKAMELSSGHWFKCENGHVYCITECGGAMEIGKCNECGAKIGGHNHRLLASNSLASEMDNARYPAWSDRNNMQNYLIDE